MYGRQAKTAGQKTPIRVDLECHRGDRYRLFLYFPVDVSPGGVDRTVAAVAFFPGQERRGPAGKRASGAGGYAIHTITLSAN